MCGIAGIIGGHCSVLWNLIPKIKKCAGEEYQLFSDSGVVFVFSGESPALWDDEQSTLKLHSNDYDIFYAEHERHFYFASEIGLMNKFGQEFQQVKKLDRGNHLVLSHR